MHYDKLQITLKEAFLSSYFCPQLSGQTYTHPPHLPLGLCPYRQINHLMEVTAINKLS